MTLFNAKDAVDNANQARAATIDEPEYHEWQQLCAVCRQGKQAPSNG